LLESETKITLPIESPQTRQAVDQRVLEIVGALVGELRVSATPIRVLPQDSLERDLGLSSLERVELLLRLERDLGVRLPDATMAEAETPADLINAVRAAGPRLPDAVPSVRAPSGPAVTAPAHVRTLTEALRWHVDATPDRVHVYLREESGVERLITYGSLWDDAVSVATALTGRGVERDDTVALMLRTEAPFFSTFFGVLLAGAVPVPIYPPFRADRIEEYAHRQSGILRNAGARILVTFAEAERVASLLRGTVPGLREVVSVDQLDGAAPGRQAVPSSADGPALIQYTSGSTGDPKGVLLTHGNILANIRAIGEAIDIRRDDAAVSWLPLYHDMGLIGAWLGALYFGVPAAILSPLAFLARPSRWLWTIHAHRGTISPAPNFAFDLCTRKIPDEELQGLDLSCWRLALNGSEAVSAETIEAFSRRFAEYGFRAAAMTPVYGLAEASVGLTMSPLDRPPRVDALSRDTFEHAREIHPAPQGDVHPLRFVSCGHPLRGHEVRVADSTGRALGERVEGHILFRGPSVTSGYFRNPAATKAARVGDWFDSGDLGYWADRELFITGRRKDMIKRAGRNIAPQDAEEIVGAIEGVRKGCVAVFGAHDPAAGTERLVIVAETRIVDTPHRERLRREIVGRVTDALGVPPDDVVVAPPGAVLKTSSGKIRRGATRDVYRRGEILKPSRSVAAQWIRLSLENVSGRVRRAVQLVFRALFTAYAALLLLLTLPLLWAGLCLVRRGRPADHLVKGWARMALRLAGMTPNVSGAEHLAAAAPAVLVMNHASYIDAIVVMAALPVDFRFVAKRRLSTYALIGSVIRRAQHVTIEKADPAQRLAGADQITSALCQGISVAVFPEGTFVRPPGILPFRLGAFRAGVDARRPVVPIALVGTRSVLPDNAWLLRPARIDVVIGAPLVPQAAGWPEMVRLRDEARATIAREVGEWLLDSIPVG
jgi:1-acyl-sn-glycerol-3-phosphate acyltransferase